MEVLIFSTCKNSAETPVTTPESSIKTEQPPLKLWYTRPAVNWMREALPFGNGSLGGMIFGGIISEEIQFNEKTLWTGSTTDKGSYQNFGSVIINFAHSSIVSDYRRELSLDTAIGSVSYKADGVSYLREYFSSYPDQVIVMRFSTPDEKGKLNMSVALNSSHSRPITAHDNSLSFSGNTTLLAYEARLTVLNEGGSRQLSGTNIQISNADTVTVLLTGGTNYDIESANYIGESSAALSRRIIETISGASAKSYKTLKEDHLNDYQELFHRVKIDLAEDMPNTPTNQLIEYNKQSRYLDMLYFQYGRYLLISSSRGMNLPNNLQGIWNNSNYPPWNADIHTNINILMNYWPAEVTNLSECHLPFLNYIHTEALRPGGNFQREAEIWGHPGWTVNTQANIFSFTQWETNRPGNAWYCMPLWQHYAYTNDSDFLMQIAYPVMQSACEFWLDRLVLNQADGTWEAPDEWSPEQGGTNSNPRPPNSYTNGYEDATSYAQQLIWDLFDKTLKAAEILNISDEFTSRVQEKFKHLYNGLAVGDWGQIKEYKYNRWGIEKPNDKHRHLSHLIALYPGNQISGFIDPQYAEAAKTSLNHRSDEGTGWSLSWKIALWARLLNGNRAYTLLKNALTQSVITDVQMSGGGVYSNLLCAHPPFQIDGNFGAAAGIAEMLLQSSQGFIHLLPALPDAWPSGSIEGLRAQGNFTVSLAWNSSGVSYTLYSGSGNVCSLYYNDERISFPTRRGSTYTGRF